MSERIRVRMMPRALRHLEEAEAWWRIHRTAAPDAIREDLNEAIDLLRMFPEIGGRARSRQYKNVRRLYLKRCRYHLYYRVQDEPRELQVLAFWHASRGTSPEL